LRKGGQDKEHLFNKEEWGSAGDAKKNRSRESYFIGQFYLGQRVSINSEFVKFSPTGRTENFLMMEHH
jgi:hypothetical protein